MGKLKGCMHAAGFILGAGLTTIGGLSVASEWEKANAGGKFGGGLIVSWAAASTALWGRRSYKAFTEKPAIILIDSAAGPEPGPRSEATSAAAFVPALELAPAPSNGS